VSRIRIVEDSPTMRSLLIAALDALSAPAKVVEVGNGLEALRLLPRGSGG
jgi:CheY-like chemotaxis protein